ncbi:MAG: hypothetical protein H6924_05100 [Alphaproteobacteria bacterium]|nr:hypothetical protein [Alphaproteobacteria bacterium]
MTSSMPQAKRQPSSHVIFCDDVRQEVGEKRTLVGVYGTELAVPQIPTLIPKFYAVTTLICYHKEMPKALSVRLAYNDEEIGRAELSPDEVQAWMKSADAELSEEVIEFPADDHPKLRLTVEICISPFVIQNVGRLASFIETDIGSVRAGSIKIIKKDGVKYGTPLRRLKA